MTGLSPGLWPDVTSEAYHADPAAGGSLSSSGARKLIPPSCPAKFRYWADHGDPPKRAWDLGHVAHRLVLGDGEEITVVDAPDWRTKAAKAQRDEARAQNRTPILAAEYETAEAMAAAVHAHPIATHLFGAGKPEQTLIWEDPDTGVTCRARLDWLADPQPGGRLIIPDYKTTASAAPEDFAKSVHNFGYHQQADWYLRGARALGLADNTAAWLFVAQEKTPPYVVTVFELDHEALTAGWVRNKWALETYAHCTRTGQWPPYSLDISLITLPPWALNLDLGDRT